MERAERFHEALLAGLDEPVRRYFMHALAEGAPLSPAARLELSGRIKVGAWLRFSSVWEGDGRSFSWRASAGPGALQLLHVHDQFRDDVGLMDIRVRAPLPRRPDVRLLHAESKDVARSGAGRAALEALWTPAALLPSRGVSWHAKADDLVVAAWDVGPERPELRIHLAPDGAVRSYSALRWRDAKHGYLPFGADVHADREFNGITPPSRLTAGWGHGTPQWAPFFEAEVTAYATVP
jgi:hypothetical protein